MEETTYTLNIRQTDTYQYDVTIPELGVTKTAATIESALNITMYAILKHLTTHALILVFADQHLDRANPRVDAQEPLKTDLEYQAAFEVGQQRIAPEVSRRERHLVFALSRPLTRAQATWLDEHAGKPFDRYYTKDELEVELDSLPEGACDTWKAAPYE